MKHRAVQATTSFASPRPLSGDVRTSQLLAAGLLMIFVALLGPGCSQDEAPEEIVIDPVSLAAVK